MSVTGRMEGHDTGALIGCIFEGGTESTEGL